VYTRTTTFDARMLEYIARWWSYNSNARVRAITVYAAALFDATTLRFGELAPCER